MSTIRTDAVASAGRSEVGDALDDRVADAVARARHARGCRRSLTGGGHAGRQPAPCRLGRTHQPLQPLAEAGCRWAQSPAPTSLCTYLGYCGGDRRLSPSDLDGDTVDAVVDAVLVGEGLDPTTVVGGGVQRPPGAIRPVS